MNLVFSGVLVLANFRYFLMTKFISLVDFLVVILKTEYVCYRLTLYS